MRRNHYTDGWGILPLKWNVADTFGGGAPRTRGVVLVEVWSTNLTQFELLKPQATVNARFELWVHRDITGWHRIKPNGDLEPIAELPQIRRWAELNETRHWSGTVALEGWK